MRLTYKDKYNRWCSDGSKASLQLGNPSENWPSILWGDAVDKLAAYEDAEEQGRLMILPCKIGDTVYVEWGRSREYSKSVVEKISIGTDGQIQFLIPTYLHSHSASWYQTRDFGKTVFLSREEAEAALKGEPDE